ncbi:hypothetical protein [Microbacterium sp. 2FI]|uniref:hypothetical protein n=1 Tax=Microbacterium sp. 2FI TaxID=2502193 RepID=UPI0010F4EA10|nr:hypothetical protein [Microbacterium sp. 2FI]
MKRLTTIGVVCATTASLLAAAPAFAAADDTVAAGDDWTVNAIAGGYEIVKTLDEPLEITASAPTVWVDGVEIGIATESEDGLEVSVTTTDPAVATAETVEQGWAGQGDPSAEESVADDAAALRSLTAPLAAAAPVLDADPSEYGAYTVGRYDYDLGDEVQVIPDFGLKGEMRAAVFLPEEAKGERPVVILLHGRHASCGGTRPAGAPAWPCSPGQTEIPSYLGYNDAAEILASQGYAVVSISANAINALDGSRADDTGAKARGQLVIDHLSLLRAADAGKFVSPEGSPVPVSAALKGRLDLDNVGLMGHSRGGEGIMRAAVLNAEQDKPFGINGVLPIAPTSYSRISVPGIPTATLLPYCDGDVEDQMGQKFINDSRHAYGDDVLRSSVLIMGTNHNFFNTIWTPGMFAFGTADDWRGFGQLDPVCGADAPTTTRLTAPEQYAVGNAYIAGFFRLTLGGEDQFLPMFDGSDAKPATVDFADIRVSATQPASTRLDLNNFDVPGSVLTVRGAGSYETCEGIASTPVPGILPYCIETLGFAQAPDWGNAGSVTSTTSNPKAPAVPSTTALHFTYTAPTGSETAGELRVPVPGGSVDATGYESLSFRVSPDEYVTTGTELTVTLLDGAGAAISVTASAYGDALTVLPGSANPLRKVLLQQLSIPLSDFAGVDLTDVREVRLAAPAEAGGVLLSDLTLLEAPTVGTPEVSTRPVASVPDVKVEEGAGPGTIRVPVVLSRPAEETATMYFSALGFASSKISPVMQKLVFAPGEQCKAVSVPFQGDANPGSAASATYAANVTNTQGGATIGDSFGRVVIREDDGLTQGTPIPPVGVPGDPCAEALAESGTLTVKSSSAKPGDSITVTGSGFRVGESVTLQLSSTAAVLATAVSTDGTVTFTTTVPADAAIGADALVATGYGSGAVSTGELKVKKNTGNGAANGR